MLDPDQKGVRDIVCAGTSGPLQSKGACRISSARGSAKLLQFEVGCAISSARGGGGVWGPCDQKGACAISSARGSWTAAIQGGRARSRSFARGLLDPCNQRGLRDIVCAGTSGRISSARGSAKLLQFEPGRAISSARELAGLLQL